MPKLGHITLEVSDTDRAIEFYTDKMGFELISRAVNNEENEEYCFLKSDDMDKTVKELRAKDIEIIRGPMEIAGEETWVYFADPDNIVLEYIQWYK